MSCARNAMSKQWMGTSFAEKFVVPASASYCAWQREKCPTSERLHWQFFVVLVKRERLTALKKMFPGAHLEIARNSSEARNYCLKEETRVSGPWEKGTFSATSCIVDALKNASAQQVLTENPTLWRSYRAMKEIKGDLQKPRYHVTEGVMMTGSTGVGKSKIVATIASFLEKEDVFWVSNYPWMDGYTGQCLAVWDEFRGISPEIGLRLVDRYPYRVQVKGSSVEWTPRMVLFTSNLSLRDCFSGVDEKTFDAIKRRIKEKKVY